MPTREEIERHNRVLLHALQTAHPVMYHGRKQFIHALMFHSPGSVVETVVYLRGQAAPVPAEELTVDPTSHDREGAMGRSRDAEGGKEK